MFCKNCGKELDANATFCPSCGTKQIQDEVSQAPVQQKKSNGFAIAGFVCSFFIPLLGAILGGIGLSKSNKTGKGFGLSVAAICISIIGFVINFINIVSVFA